MTLRIEELTKINRGGYLLDHTLNIEDANKINTLINLIEDREQTPTDGDIIIIKHPEKGVLYENAHLEIGGSTGQMYDNGMTVCTKPYTPFIHLIDGKLSKTSASGGYWKGVEPEKLKHLCTKRKTFCTWGHLGMRGNGAVDFKAEVNVWEYTDAEFY